MAYFLLKLIILAIFINSDFCWRVEKMPRYYGDRVPQKVISTKLQCVQKRIVMLHDYFRTKVEPKASNMLSMSWHRGAAKNAQKWADTCQYLKHDPPSSRETRDFKKCGQNIFISTAKVPWLFALRSWFNEYQNFTYGSDTNPIHVVGHYTQMVWAATHKVGCGIAKCPSGGPRGKPFYNYVCNYCPSGNYANSLGTPYKKGRPCGSCPGACRSKRIKLCTNSCNANDFWSNCQSLYSSYPGWLCDTDTQQGRERKENCRATCTCSGKIFD